MVDEQAQATATAAPVRTPESRIIDYFGNPFPIENFLEHKTAVEGIPLYSCRWPATAQPPRGVVIYFTGYGSYVGRYGFIAKFYAERGYDFVAMDYEGYGRSGGPRSVIKSKDGLYEDCTQFLIKVRSYY